MWDQIEPTPPHLSYLILSIFLIAYTLFASFIRNRLHLSEPPIALAVGILLGPRCLGWLTPNFRGVLGDHDDQGILQNPWLGGWGWGDDVSEYGPKHSAASMLTNERSPGDQPSDCRHPGLCCRRRTA